MAISRLLTPKFRSTLGCTICFNIEGEAYCYSAFLCGRHCSTWSRSSNVMKILSSGFRVKLVSDISGLMSSFIKYANSVCTLWIAVGRHNFFLGISYFINCPNMTSNLWYAPHFSWGWFDVFEVGLNLSLKAVGCLDHLLVATSCFVNVSNNEETLYMYFLAFWSTVLLGEYVSKYQRVTFDV